jgi:membrane associated rhomboid family serine protease
MNQAPVRFRWPWACVVIAVAEYLIYRWQQGSIGYGLGDLLFRDYAFEWSRLRASPLSELPTLVSHTLLHADPGHLGGNLLFFLFFGPILESTLGAAAFCGVYLVAGAAAAVVQGIFAPFGPSLIGASGAISGVMGAVFVLYPLRLPFFPWITALSGSLGRIPSFLYIGAWFLLNVAMGLTLLHPMPAQLVPNIGYWAHVGGFAAGAFLMAPRIIRRAPPAPTAEK